ncbi:MAG TPA: hypothetical protein VF459_07155 [Caulobacteraceae bacterium]
MPPQLLTSVRSNGSLFVGSGAAAKRPIHALLVASAIAISAEIETQKGQMLAALLGANARPAAAMFTSLTSSVAQSASLRAVVDVTLSGEQLDIFEAVMRLCDIALKDRNRFAHWVWGTVHELEDALAFIDPEAMIDYSVKKHDRRFHVFGAPGILQGLSSDDFDYSRVWIYRQKDLIEAVGSLQQACENISALRFVAGRSDSQADQLYQEIKTRPEIASELARLNKKRETRPDARSQRRRKGRSEK